MVCLGSHSQTCGRIWLDPKAPASISLAPFGPRGEGLLIISDVVGEGNGLDGMLFVYP